MNEQDLKNSILQLAIQGKLVEQREEEGTAKELLEDIRAEKEQLIKDGKIRKEKPLPEITEDEIPFDIPESWEWVRLGDLCEKLGSGSTPAGGKAVYKESGIKFLRSQNIYNEGLQMKGIVYISEEQNKLGSIVKPKDILLNITGGSIGRCALVPDDFDIANINQHVMIIRNITLENRFLLHYVLMSSYIQSMIMSVQIGVSREGLSAKRLKEFLIPLPPLEEQKRIVSKIEEVTPYAEKYGEAYSKVEGLNKKFPEDMQKSILQYAIQGKLVEQREEEGTAEELYKQIQEEKEKLIKEGKVRKEKPLEEITKEEIPFDIPESWKWVKLLDVCKIIHYGYTTSACEVGNCKLLRITDIQDNSVEWDKVPFCTVKESEYVTYGLKNRDIMIARTGGTIGKTYIVESLKDKVVFASYLIRAVPVENINERYLKKYMESPLYWMQLKSSSMGTGQPNVNGTALKNLLVPLPPIDEQTRIVSELEKMLPYCQQLIK